MALVKLLCNRVGWGEVLGWEQPQAEVSYRFSKFLTSVQYILLNKHFAVCCIPLVNFQSVCIFFYKLVQFYLAF